MLLRKATAGLVPMVTTERSENRERYHAANLVCRAGPTKGALMQIRRASADRWSSSLA